MEEKENRELFKEVSWLYDRLSKKEMNILMKWVGSNCDTIKEKILEMIRRRENLLWKWMKEENKDSKYFVFLQGSLNEIASLEREILD